MINARLAWVIMELPSPLVLSFFFWTGSSTNKYTIFFWALWLIHYTNRTFIYPFRQRDHGKEMPIAIMGSAIFFNCVNGFVVGYFLGNYGELYAADYYISFNFIVGILVFLIGMGVNIQSDNILLNLRKPGETGYKIPRGGFYRFVSCPNLMGEMLEWIGYAIMLGALPAWSFAIWTFANLAPRAIAHHQWYLDKFETYPSERKAFIPFIW